MLRESGRRKVVLFDDQAGPDLPQQFVLAQQFAAALDQGQQQIANQPTMRARTLSTIKPL